MPVGVFVWTLENVGTDDLEVTIMFTFQNGDGGSEDSAGGLYNEEFICKGVYSEIQLRNSTVENSKEPSDIEESSSTTGQYKDDSCIKTNDSNSDTLYLNKTNMNDHNQNLRVSPQEQCIVHDVQGVLLHHKGLKQNYTLAIAAKQITEVIIFQFSFVRTTTVVQIHCKIHGRERCQNVTIRH